MYLCDISCNVCRNTNRQLNKIRSTINQQNKKFNKETDYLKDKKKVSFMILLISVLSLFSLVSVAKSLSILFIFSKNQLFCLFSIIFLFSVSFISALIFVISLPLLTLGSVCFCFSSFLRHRFIYLNLSCFCLLQ